MYIGVSYALHLLWAVLDEKKVLIMTCRRRIFFTDYLIIMAVIDYYFWLMSVCLIWKGLYKRLGKERGKVTIKLKKVKWQETPLRLNFLVVKVSGLFQESKVIHERMFFYLVALAADRWSVATPCLPRAWVIFTCIEVKPEWYSRVFRWSLNDIPMYSGEAWVIFICIQMKSEWY